MFISQELIHFLDYGRDGDNMMLKYDMKKTYDGLERSFEIYAKKTLF